MNTVARVLKSYSGGSKKLNLISPVLIFKLGLPPCHGWVFSLIDFLGLKELCEKMNVNGSLGMDRPQEIIFNWWRST